MISIEQINGEIAVLEDEKPTFEVMRKLADLYTVRDHIIIHREQEPVYLDSDTEFSEIVNGRSPNDVLPVLDEMMIAVEVINPQLYNATMRKLRGL